MKFYNRTTEIEELQRIQGLAFDTNLIRLTKTCNRIILIINKF